VDGINSSSAAKFTIARNDEDSSELNIYKTMATVICESPKAGDKFNVKCEVLGIDETFEYKGIESLQESYRNRAR